MIRWVPNSWTRPRSTLKGWPASATSSPITNTVGSRRISSAIASRTASPYVSSRTSTLGALGIDILVHLARLGERRLQGVPDAGLDLGLDVGEDALEHRRLGKTLRNEPLRQRLEWVVVGHPVALFVARTVLAVHVTDVVTVV